MSHVAQVDIEIKDLEALKAACKRIGLEFRENQKNYKWWGRSVGDYPLPAGFKQEELGTCEHALSVTGNPQAYEIGVVKRRDGKQGFSLLWDFYAGGYGLQDKVGVDCKNLRQAYATEVSVRQLRRQGYRVQEARQQDGTIKLVARK